MPFSHPVSLFIVPNWHLPLCLRPGGSRRVGEEGWGGDQGNLIRLCLFLQPFAKLAFLGNWALMPGVWERWETPHDSGEVMCCREMPEQVLGCGRMQAPGEEAGTTDLLIPTGPHTCPGLDTLHGTLIIISLCIPKPLSPSLPRRRQPLAVLTGEEGSELSFPQCSFITQPHSHRGEGTSLRS